MKSGFETRRLAIPLAQFAVGPVLLFGVPFTGAFLYSGFDQGLLLYKLYAWASTLNAFPYGQFLLVALIGLSSLATCRVTAAYRA